jgi:hypothetical protein
MPIEIKDLNLTPEEIQELVIGAQTFLAPAPDPADEDKLTPPENSES